MDRSIDFTPFQQPAPQLANQFDADRPLQSLLRRVLPPEVLAGVTPSLRAMGELASGELAWLQQADRLNEPVLTNWNPWGERIDQIEVSPLWKRCERIVPEHGVVAAAYEPHFGAYSRIHQFALAYLFGPSSDVYTCPLAMTDGAARTLLATGNEKLIAHAVPHLTTRNPDAFWTSGQWMTESTGGSDVGLSETMAQRTGGDAYRLFGRKWFTSATTSQMALTLGRVEGAGPGGRGLSLFYVETRDAAGKLQNIEVNRLKDKFGTRKVPTAELMLRGTPATLVCGEGSGIKNITPMLSVTRTWNAVMSAALMRRGVVLARDYAKKRVAFGAPLSEKPLHLDTLATLAAESEASLHLSFHVVAILGRIERNEARAMDDALLRLLTPIMKLTTGKQAVSVLSEVLECFGGAGYVEDTGLPTLYRDAQVLPIWEGTTNVLSLDTLRAFGHAAEMQEALTHEVARIQATLTDAALKEAGSRAAQAIAKAVRWLSKTFADAPLDVEAGARRFAMTLGRSLSLLLFAEHADWALRVEGDGARRAACLVYAGLPFDLVRDVPRADARLVAMDE
jgi:alkylation response protein AidB-like acyl-CoA dehydrogenase